MNELDQIVRSYIFVVVKVLFKKFNQFFFCYHFRNYKIYVEKKSLKIFMML